ncbi:hypothetical protein ACQ859_09350 [Roseateles chitinivorans]|uniref:hypothetical protein n=1 Tax=Roseateles chitinivorans TaxID=2917965 RepID=UPI003D66967B
MSLVVLSLLLAGLPLWLVFDEHFLGAYRAHPAVLLPSLFVLGLLVAIRPSMDASLEIRTPTPWVRTLLKPVVALLLAGALYVIGCGWVAATSRLLARTPATIVLEVLNIDRDETRRSTCLQRVELSYQGRWHRVCVDELPVRGHLVAGTTLAGIGRVSPLGFHLEALRAP